MCLSYALIDYTEYLLCSTLIEDGIVTVSAIPCHRLSHTVLLLDTVFSNFGIDMACLFSTLVPHQMHMEEGDILHYKEQLYSRMECPPLQTFCSRVEDILHRGNPAI